MSAATTLEQHVSTPVKEEFPLEKGRACLGPVENYISAHWRKSYKLTRKRNPAVEMMPRSHWKARAKVDVTTYHRIDAHCHYACFAR
eukprot:7770419-Pyramimonas_sp.AAC.1